jgi:long-chain acyl-CoA synthetase
MRLCHPARAPPVHTPWLPTTRPAFRPRRTSTPTQPGRSAGSRLPAPCQARRAGLHGQPVSFGQISTELSSALGAWLQSLGLKRGDRVALMMPNVPQYLVAIAAMLRAGWWWSTSTRCTPRASLQHQLNDSGAVAIVVLENFAHTLEEVIEHTQVQTRGAGVDGRTAGLLVRPLVNFAVRHVAKMVPEFRLPLDHGRTVTRFCEALESGQRMALKRVAVGRRRRLPAVHRRHHRRVQGRHAAAPQRGGQHHAVRGLVQAHARQGRPQAS